MEDFILRRRESNFQYRTVKTLFLQEKREKKVIIIYETAHVESQPREDCTWQANAGQTAELILEARREP